MYDDQTNNNPTNDQTSPILGADQTTPTMGGLGSNPTNPAPTMDSSAPPAASAAATPLITPTVTPTEDLIAIKKKALDELSPLVGKLTQSPEEKYKTLMMMIQASDNHNLVEEAYEAAQKISDEKARAEALLNIVNEINYFTQKSA